jgi:hypothetical protein
MFSRYQPKVSYILQKSKIVLLSEKKKFFISFLYSIVVKLGTAINSFISKFCFWHGLLNPYLLFHGAVWWHCSVTAVTYINLTHCTSRCTTSSVWGTHCWSDECLVTFQAISILLIFTEWGVLSAHTCPQAMNGV